MKAAIATCSLGLLFAPGAAFIAGHRGAPIENRDPVSFPGLSHGWNGFTEFGRYLNDRLPLRARAIRGDAWIDQNLFNEDPAFGGTATPRVITGRSGLLFLADAIDNACAPHAPAPETVDHLKRFAAIVSGSGRKVLAMIAPDKSSVHPELLPDGLDKRKCFDAYSDDLWGRLDRAGIAGFVDLRTALRAASARSREPLYLRKDSHWDNAGSLVAVKAAIDAFAPGLWRDSEVQYKGLGEYTGDLTGLQGHPRVDQAPIYSIVRPDVTSVSSTAIDNIEGGFNKRYVNSAPAGRLIPGHTVMFLDSYGLAALPQIVPFFADLTVMRLVDFNADRFSSLIAGADKVWLLSVERSSSYRFSFEIGSSIFLDQLEATLKK